MFSSNTEDINTNMHTSNLLQGHAYLLRVSRSNRVSGVVQSHMCRVPLVLTRSMHWWKLALNLLHIHWQFAWRKALHPKTWAYRPRTRGFRPVTPNTPNHWTGPTISCLSRNDAQFRRLHLLLVMEQGVPKAASQAPPFKIHVKGVDACQRITHE